MTLPSNRFVETTEEVIIAAGPPRRHRGFPTGVRLPDGDVLVGFRVGSDHHMTHDGAFYLTRSSDNGQHWTPPKVLSAYPGWDVCAAMGQYEDGVMPEDEPFLWARLMMYRWIPDAPDDMDFRTFQTYWTTSADYGHNWSAPFPLYVEPPAPTVRTDRGEMVLGSLNPHSYSATLMRLSDGTIMGMFTGNKELMKYRKQAELRRQGKASHALTEMPLAGFSKDNLRTWEYVVVADPDEYGVGFSESDIVRLDSGRIVAIYGNNQNSRSFWRTYSDDEGRTWAPMKELTFIGDSPSMVKLADGTLVAAIRALDEGAVGIGLVASTDGGETWEQLGNLSEQGGWDMAYPDLIKLADGNFLCVYYTSADAKMIRADLAEKLARIEPMATQIGIGLRPSAYEELDGEIRGMFLTDLTAGKAGASNTSVAHQKSKVEL